MAPNLDLIAWLISLLPHTDQSLAPFRNAFALKPHIPQVNEGIFLCAASSLRHVYLLWVYMMEFNYTASNHCFHIFCIYIYICFWCIFSVWGFWKQKLLVRHFCIPVSWIIPDTFVELNWNFNTCPKIVIKDTKLLLAALNKSKMTEYWI